MHFKTNNNIPNINFKFINFKILGNFYKKFNDFFLKKNTLNIYLNMHKDALKSYALSMFNMAA